MYFKRSINQMQSAIPFEIDIVKDYIHADFTEQDSRWYPIIPCTRLQAELLCWLPPRKRYFYQGKEINALLIHVKSGWKEEGKKKKNLRTLTYCTVTLKEFTTIIW